MTPVRSAVPGAPTTSAAARDGDDVVFTALRPMYALGGRSPEERARAHAANVAHRWQDARDFQRFLDAHVAEAEQAKTLDAFLAHGRPVLATWERRLAEPGATAAERRDLEPVVAAFRRSLRDALARLEGIRARLEGRRAPLDVDVIATVAVKAEVRGHAAGVEASLRDGAVTGAVATPFGTAKTTVKGGVPRDRLELDGGPVAATVGGDRLERLELRAPGGGLAALEGVAVEVGFAGGRRVRLGEDVAVAVEAKLAVSVTGLDRETARRALSSADEWRVRR